MYETLKRLWIEGKLTPDMMQRAVTEKGWITQEKCDFIINSYQHGNEEQEELYY